MNDLLLRLILLIFLIIPLQTAWGKSHFLHSKGSSSFLLSYSYYKSMREYGYNQQLIALDTHFEKHSMSGQLKHGITDYLTFQVKLPYSHLSLIQESSDNLTIGGLGDGWWGFSLPVFNLANWNWQLSASLLFTLPSGTTYEKKYLDSHLFIGKGFTQYHFLLHNEIRVSRLQFIVETGFIYSLPNYLLYEPRDDNSMFLNYIAPGPQTDLRAQIIVPLGYQFAFLVDGKLVYQFASSKSLGEHDTLIKIPYSDRFEFTSSPGISYGQTSSFSILLQGEFSLIGKNSTQFFPLNYAHNGLQLKTDYRF